MNQAQLYTEAVSLLKALIATPSFSKQEAGTAALIKSRLEAGGIPVSQTGHNLIARNRFFDAAKPTLLLNSHHDTVKPNPHYSLDPFTAIEKEGRLYGLGSNDAGGCLVSLIAAFTHFFEREDLRYNLVLVASAEEEISGLNGIEAVIPELPPIEAAIVGEPTLMQLAVAERGLMVLDLTTRGKAGHAARKEGENAIYKAMREIQWFEQYQFERVSPLLGPNQLSVTVIETENKAHNVVPAICKYVVDVRINELYSFEEVLEEIGRHIQSECKPRSMRLRSTSIPLDHPLVQAGQSMGKTCYGSPTTSDKALMPFVALKMGPGDSARSHTADEFIYIEEIRQGIDDYITLLSKVIL